MKIIYEAMSVNIKCKERHKDDWRTFHHKDICGRIGRVVKDDSFIDQNAPLV